MSNELQDEFQGNEKDLIEKLKKEHEVKGEPRVFKID